MEEKYCLNCGKILNKKTQKKFCCASCAATINNKNRINTTKGKTKIQRCIRCGEEFYASIHVPKNKCICEKCKSHNRPHFKNREDIKTLNDISKRTFVKILKRMHASCSLCGWSEASCDVHHIISKKEGGTDDFSNLIVLCPNCHRICHVTNKYSNEFLSSRNITIKYKNWMDFYHNSN